MTTINTEKLKCYLCGLKSNHPTVSSTNAFGFSDLDTRPPEMSRSTMHTWVQRCNHCGYCSFDITNSHGNILHNFLKKIGNFFISSSTTLQTFVKNEKYQSQLKNKDFPDLANSFLCEAMIEENKGNFSKATWAVISAAWTCDDSGDVQLSKNCRKKAVKLLKKTLEKKEDFVNEDGLEITIMADLLRRSEQFKEASEIIDKNLGKRSKDINKILMFQKKLISVSDLKCHTLEECFEDNKA